MKPLAPPVTEYRVMGSVDVVSGLVLALLLGPADQLVFLPIMAAVFGVVVYLGTYPRFARRGADAPQPAPTDEREPPLATYRRTLLIAGAAVVFCVVLIFLSSIPAALCGIVVGTGVGLLVGAHRLRRWERAHDRVLLREPRFRWGQAGGMDPREFYAASTVSARSIPKLPPPQRAPIV
jgi:hypothetical protein